MQSQDKSGAAKLAKLGLMLALAVIMGYVELLIPISLGMPGIKAGFANIVILFVLYTFGFKEALMISALRTLIIAFLFTSPAMLLYSFTASVVSTAIMNVYKRKSCFSIYGISALGGVAHNITQFIVALIIAAFGNRNALGFMLSFYLPLLLLAGEAAGMINAVIVNGIMRRVGPPHQKGKDSLCTHT